MHNAIEDVGSIKRVCIHIYIYICLCMYVCVYVCLFVYIHEGFGDLGLQLEFCVGFLF